MFDARLRRAINPVLDTCAAQLAKASIGANTLTLIGALLGVVAAAMIAREHFALALAFIALNRLFDGLDGRVAAINGPTEFGGYLDSLCDFLFYVAVPIGFGIASPDNLLPALILVAAFTLTGVSFLAYAAIAARNALDNSTHGPKAFIYSTGIMEGAETIAFFLVMCLLPAHFAVLAYLFAGLCALTVLQRVWMAAILLRR
jgi:phosphatidylglycerophosphate synthase